jgi:hypothetical protein
LDPDDIAYQSLESVRFTVSSETIQEQMLGLRRGVFRLEVQRGLLMTERVLFAPQFEQ